MTGWTDQRIEAGLAALASELDVPAAPAADAMEARRRSRRRLLLAAAVVLAVVAGVVAVTPATRRAVAGWLGLRTVTLERVEPGAAGSGGLGRFADGVDALDVSAALDIVDLDADRLKHARLGRPDRAGRPPEGGVVVAWDDGATTLWVRSPPWAAADAPVIKRLHAEDRAEPVPGLGDAALYIAGEHVLSTPARRVAADRVVWWILDDVEHRLEGDRPRDDLIAIARELAP